jgi:hypothetical protein
MSGMYCSWELRREGHSRNKTASDARLPHEDAGTKMKRVITLSLLAFALGACTDEDGATRALEAAGYRGVRIEGYAFFGCGNGDSYHTAFTAIGQNGRAVTGVVCGGWSLFGKASTIRTFS